MEITIHTGAQGAQNLIHVDWFDENNVRQSTAIEANIREQDKPRELEIKVGGRVVVIMRSNGEGRWP